MLRYLLGRRVINTDTGAAGARGSTDIPARPPHIRSCSRIRGTTRHASASMIIFGLAAACSQGDIPSEQRMTGADPAAGNAAIAEVACGICHVIPGVPGATGVVGPSLAGFGRRQLIGGIVPNEPAALIRWVSNAPSIAPDTGMPELPLTETQARDIAAYLLTLR